MNELTDLLFIYEANKAAVPIVIGLFTGFLIVVNIFALIIRTMQGALD